MRVFRQTVLCLIVLLEILIGSLAGATERFVPVYPTDPDRPRSMTWPLVFTTLLPGFDQWYEGQQTEGSILSGAAFGGLLLASSARLEETGGDVLASRDDRVRSAVLGFQIYSAAGSFSAFHSFRSAAKTWPGQFEFMKTAENEGLDDLVSAPWDFSMLKRSTTWGALALAIGIAAVDVASVDSIWSRNSYDLRDLGFGTAFSTFAGMHEEALFRGTMQPLFRRNWGSEWGSNLATSVIFGAAHYSETNRFPLAQTLAGYYLGWVAMENGWSLRESIFIHTWWDIILLNAQYLIESRDRSRDVIYRLPKLQLSF